MRRFAGPLSVLLIAWAVSSRADQVLVEAESFAQPGGWQLDTQFIKIMGSPYLLAHGLGQSVEDATTTVRFPSTGEYRVWVRTKDWVARWNATGQPGRFQVWVDGQPLAETFGTKGADWFWHDGGAVSIKQQDVKLALRDLTGFNGRCDAIFFSSDTNVTPPSGAEILPAWRRSLLGLSEQPTELSGYDLVVAGGGYSGMGAAISAARMGCKVALIQDRPVLGGNGSSEVRVWANGLIRRGRFPRVGEIVAEFMDRAKKSPGTAEEFGDDVKEAVVQAEKNIDLFLNHFAYQVEMEGERIKALSAFDTRTSEHKRFTGRLFCDATGHGTLGALAGAHYDMTPKGRMGMSNMWSWAEAQEPAAFPETPWALDLKMDDFPYPREFHGQWFWESGFDKDPINDAEAIRDWNLRAVFGAFNAMKNRDGAEKHRNAILTWVAYIGGTRESRRLLGDVILSEEDIIAKRDFPDGCVPSTWSIDLHYPKQQYAEKFPDNPFISVAKFDHRVDRAYGYPVPYRCFYSRNIPNLFMAGRCVSVTHEALGTVRVMNTCGMMGEVVGRAASICVAQDCTPRDVYEKHLEELKKLLDLPGKARRATVNAPIVIPDDIPRRASEFGPPSGLDPETLPGVVIDDRQAIKQGSWTEGTGLKGYVGYGYLYAAAGSGASIRFEFKPPAAGRYEVRLAYQTHENRGTRVPVTVTSPAGTVQQQINMREPPPVDQGFVSLGRFEFRPDAPAAVEIGTQDAGGTVHADAVQFLPVK
jgi:hypothetical protein